VIVALVSILTRSTQLYRSLLAARDQRSPSLLVCRTENTSSLVHHHFCIDYEQTTLSNRIIVRRTSRITPTEPERKQFIIQNKRKLSQLLLIIVNDRKSATNVAFDHLNLKKTNF
jgi:hypothetical protein